MGYLLIMIELLIGNVGTVIRKHYIKKTAHLSTSNNIYILLAHPVAAVYFFIMAKGNVSLNTPTFFFSLLYAVCCLSSVIISFYAYQETNLVYMSVFGGAGRFIIPFFVEMFFWNEKFSVCEIISVVIRTLAIFIPLFFAKEQKKGLKICILLFLVSAVSRILTKSYAVTPSVLSETSWFFWTNVFIIPLTFVIILKREGAEAIKRDVKKISPYLYIYILAGTAISNSSAVISVQVLRLLSATASSVVSAAIGMVITVLLSTLIYKEDVNKVTYISAGLSAAAGILSVF